ncbi:hypothetical protein HDU97_006501 [Phlyctochytrium planicorne]|nr:hypothetical protein HDU97_006501 [Phlyctochytrium planicorne]
MVTEDGHDGASDTGGDDMDGEHGTFCRQNLSHQELKDLTSAVSHAIGSDYLTSLEAFGFPELNADETDGANNQQTKREGMDSARMTRSRGSVSSPTTTTSAASPRSSSTYATSPSALNQMELNDPMLLNNMDSLIIQAEPRLLDGSSLSVSQQAWARQLEQDNLAGFDGSIPFTSSSAIPIPPSFASSNVIRQQFQHHRAATGGSTGNNLFIPSDPSLPPQNPGQLPRASTIPRSSASMRILQHPVYTVADSDELLNQTLRHDSKMTNSASTDMGFGAGSSSALMQQKQGGTVRKSASNISVLQGGSISPVGTGSSKSPPSSESTMNSLLAVDDLDLVDPQQSSTDFMDMGVVGDPRAFPFLPGQQMMPGSFVNPLGINTPFTPFPNQPPPGIGFPSFAAPPSAYPRPPIPPTHPSYSIPPNQPRKRVATQQSIPNPPTIGPIAPADHQPDRSGRATRSARSGSGDDHGSSGDDVDDELKLKRKRNTEAARRSRQKKNNRLMDLENFTKRLEAQNSTLTVRVAVLENEKETLLFRQKELLDRVASLEKQLQEAHRSLFSLTVSGDAAPVPNGSHGVNGSHGETDGLNGLNGMGKEGK